MNFSKYFINTIGSVILVAILDAHFFRDAFLNPNIDTVSLAVGISLWGVGYIAETFFEDLEERAEGGDVIE